MGALTGERVLLRRWRLSDRPAFRRMGQDARVMEFLPAPLSAAEADALAERLDADVRERGWGLWALEVPGVAGFGGFVGLKPLAADLPFAPGVEIAWRLDHGLWGQGYASEAARLALDFAFVRLGLAEVVAFTAIANGRSLAVMQRIGMAAVGEFDHPVLPQGHRLRRHALYRKTAP